MGSDADSRTQLPLARWRPPPPPPHLCIARRDRAACLPTQPAQAGKIEFRTDKQGIVHVPIGKSDFSEADLSKNLAAICDTIEKNRPTGCKGKLWNTAALSTTMGPSIKLDLGELKAFGGVAA